MCCCNYLYSVQTNTDITLPNVCYDARDSRIVIEVCVCTLSIAIIYKHKSVLYYSYGRKLQENLCWQIVQNSDGQTAILCMRMLQCSVLTVGQRVSKTYSMYLKLRISFQL